VKDPQAGPLVHYRDGSSSISISDMDIRICNSRFCEPVKTVEPDSLWVVGKQVGLIFRKEEKKVVIEYGRMKARDSEVLLGSKVGVKNISL